MASSISRICRCACSAPPTRVSTAKASCCRPCLVSQRGLSGTTSRQSRNSTAGSTSEPNIHRQPVLTFHDSPGADSATSQLTMATTSMPEMMAIWLSETNRPRRWAGATSAMYSGESIDAMPTPSPPTNRAITNSEKVRGRADPMADTANSTADSSRTLLRPKRSLKGPAQAAPIMHPTRTLETAQPFQTSFSSKRVTRKSIAPEITAVS